MNRSRILDSLLWSLIVLCVTLGLVAALAHKRLRDEVNGLRLEAATLRSETAALESNRAITLTALTDLQEVIRRQTVGTATDAANEAFRRFVDAYVDAVGARLAQDHPRAQRLYEEALAVPNVGLLDIQWRLRAMEGLAYAQMRQGSYTDARLTLETLEEARLDADPRFLFVFGRLTRIKTMCVSGASEAEISQALTTLRSDFDAYRANQPTAGLTRWAEIDRRYIEEDAELFDLCGRAGVKPLQLPVLEPVASPTPTR